MSSDHSPDRDQSCNCQQVVKAAFDLTEQAEDATLSVCLACGKAGSRDSTGGYLLVLCPEHKVQRRRSVAGLPLIAWDALDDVDS